MAQAFHVQLRKNLRTLSNKILSRLFPVKLNEKAIPKEKIQKILVVRINYRIGNILFITPLLNALAKEFPFAKIDMMVGAPFTASLIEGMPQINKVYSFPRKLLKQPLKVLKLKKELKENAYDLLVTPNLSSSSDTLFTFLVSATYKVGFYAKDRFSPLTHPIARVKDIHHEALKPLALMSAFSNKKIEEYTPYLDIRLTEEERAIVEADIPQKTIGIFRDARNQKKIDNGYWIELLEALKHKDSSLKFIDILDPNNKTALQKEIPTLSEKNLRVLASKISYLDAFICGDTGPMHLASASKTPTIALFKTTSPSNYGTLGEKDLSIVIGGKGVAEVAEEIFKHL